jgi:hypothetical protein
MEHTGRVLSQIPYVDRVQGTVVPEPSIHPHAPARNHMRPPVGPSCRHPIVRRLSQPTLHCRPFENALVAVWNSVTIGHLGSIT